MPDTDKQFDGLPWIVKQFEDGKTIGIEVWPNDDQGPRAVVNWQEFSSSPVGYSKRLNDATRAAECRNALAGLNPDGVAELVAAGEALIANIYEECGDLSNVRKEYKALAAALANVKGGV